MDDFQGIRAMQSEIQVMIDNLKEMVRELVEPTAEQGVPSHTESVVRTSTTTDTLKPFFSAASSCRR